MLDIEVHDDLVRYLRDHGWISGTNPTCHTLAGGVSCRTVLVQHEGTDLVCKQALEFLRVAEEWQADPERIEIEADAIRVLTEMLEPGQVPELVFEDETEQLIAMTAVPQPHDNWKSLLLGGRIDDDLVVDFALLLGTMHAASWERRDELSQRFADRSQFVLLRMDAYYRFTTGRHPELSQWFDRLIDDTGATTCALVHGDFSPKNVLIHDGRCVLLDHEVSHWGDPGFDIGFASAHFLGKANHLTELRPQFAEAAKLFWATYCERVRDLPWFADLEERAVRHTIGCTLARVDGKSPLEYLTEPERIAQREAVVALIADVPARYATTVDRYIAALDR